MVMRLSGLIVALTVSAATSLFATTAKAQLGVGLDCINGIDCTIPIPLSVYTLDEAMNRAYYSNDKPAYQDQVFPRQLFFLLGPSFNLLQGNYPENEITKDAVVIHNLYVEALRLQNSSDPVIRTRNLPNPYNTSVLLLLPNIIETPVPGVIERPSPGIELYNEGLPPQ